MPSHARKDLNVEKFSKVESPFPELGITKKVTNSSGTTFIVVTEGMNPKTIFEFTLNSQQIFSALSDNDVSIEDEARKYGKEVLRGKSFPPLSSKQA